MSIQKKEYLFAFAVIILTGLICPAISAEGQGTLTYDDILKMDCLKQIVLTPDGTKILYLVTEGDDLLPPGNNGTLKMIQLSSGDETDITLPDETVTVWGVSPDSAKVAYGGMSRSGGSPYLSFVDLSSGKIEKKSNVPDELLDGFIWAGPDSLAFLGASPDTPVDESLNQVIVMDEKPDPVILKSYDITSGQVTNLTSNTDVIYEYKPSPDGKYITYKSSVYPESWEDKPEFTYYLLNIETGTEDEIMTREEGYQDENEFAWAPDSSLVYIERNINGGMHYPLAYLRDIVVYSPVTKSLEEIPIPWERKLHQDLFNSDVEINPFNGGAYVLLSDGANPKLAKIERDSSGWNMNILEGKHQGNIFALETDTDGRTIYYNYNTASVPPQIFKADLSGKTIVSPVQLTHLHADLLKKDLGSSEVIEWTGALNDTVQAVIRYPPGYKPGQKYPLVFVIHGGPNYTDFDSWRDTWEFPYHLITNTGVIALSVNYHGSSNFGFDFIQSIEGGGYYDLPVEDFIKGIEYLDNKGIIDTNKIAATGWSNGGILTLSFITKYQGLKAAVSGAGTANEYAQVANSNGIVMNRMYHDKTPFEDPDYYRPLLGVYHTQNVTTPLLMLQGTTDNAVVPEGAIATYRAYKMGSKSEVRMVIFKGEPHHMKHYDTQLRKVTEEITWITSHLFSS